MMMRLPLMIVLGAMVVPGASAVVPGANGTDWGDPIVVVEVPRRTLESLRPDPLGRVRRNVCEGGKLVLVAADGRRRELLKGFHSACEPDVSFDGKRILFSAKRRAADAWNVFEMDLDSGAPRQITRDFGNCRSPIYLSTLFTLDSPEPWSILAFVSDASGEFNEIGQDRSTSLYSCRMDGSEVRRLTFNPSADLDPFQVWDGRIIYSTWERSLLEHGALGRFTLFSIYSDGTDVFPFVAHAGLDVKQMPAVSDRGLALFVEGDAVSPDGGGQLSRVLLERPTRTYRPLTRPEEGRFRSPSPVPGGRFLVSRMAPGTRSLYEVVLFDPEAGSHSPVYRSSSSHALFAKRVGARPAPDGRSTVVEDVHVNGQMYGVDIGIHQLPHRDWLNAAIGKRLRVLEAIPRTMHRSTDAESSFLEKRILGEARVEDDGSFFFKVPANIPIQLQLLDQDGLAVQSCAWIWVKNNENRGCIGCHEHPELTPPNRLPKAVVRPAQQLTLPPARRRTVNFTRDVMPLVQESCATAGCHNPDGKPDLTRHTGESDPAYALRLFRLLTVREEGQTGFEGRWVHPGRARTSPLIWHILGKVTVRPWDDPVTSPGIPTGGKQRLQDLDAKAFIEWIDMGAHGPDQPEPGNRRPAAGAAGGAQ